MNTFTNIIIKITCSKRRIFPITPTHVINYTSNDLEKYCFTNKIRNFKLKSFFNESLL